MALKGFLASGFQKLIGASRIKGANEQWLGEPNVQTLTVSSGQITNTLNYGNNVFVTSSPQALSSAALVSTLPSFDCYITVVNTSTNTFNAVTLTTNATPSAGGVYVESTHYIRPYQSITLFYNSSTQLFYVVEAPYDRLTVDTLAISNGATSIQLDQYSNNQFLVLNLTPGIVANIATIVPLATSFTAAPIELKITAVNFNASETEVSFIQDVNNTTTNGLLLNGDFKLNRFGVLNLVYDKTISKWIEISRSTSSY